MDRCPQAWTTPTHGATPSISERGIHGGRGCGGAEFGADCPQYSEAIRESVEVACAEVADSLEARNFRNPEAGFRYPHVNECLYLEAVTPEHRSPLATLEFGGVKVHDVE